MIGIPGWWDVQGWGTEPVDYVLSYARDQGYKAVYLFSVRSGSYWLRLGFRDVPVDELLQAIPDAYQDQYFGIIGKLAKAQAWKKDF
jgi:N-acetylglutamate synthase-like GNAT family acetyltransferase